MLESKTTEIIDENTQLENQESTATIDTSNEETSKKQASKKKLIVISLVAILFLATVIAGFAIAFSGNGSETYIPENVIKEEILEEVAEIVEEELEVEEETLEIYRIADFIFTINTEIAEQVLNTMSFTFTDLNDGELAYAFEVPTLNEVREVDFTFVSDGVYELSSFRAPVTLYAELLIPEQGLPYDINVEDGIPSLLENENDESDITMEVIDNTLVTTIPLIVVPLEEQTNDEIAYVISELEFWLSANPDDTRIPTVNDSLNNANYILENRPEDEVVTDPDRPVVETPPTPPTPPVIETPGNGGGGNVQQPPAHVCNWVRVYVDQTYISVAGTPGSPAVPGTPNQYGTVNVHQCSCGAIFRGGTSEQNRDAFSAHRLASGDFTKTSTFWPEQVLIQAGTPGTPAVPPTPNQYGTRRVFSHYACACGATR